MLCEPWHRMAKMWGRRPASGPRFDWHVCVACLLASARSLACLFNMWYIYLEKEIYDEKSTNIFKHNLWYNFIFEIKTHLVYVVLSYAYIHSAPIRLTHNHIAIALNLDGWPQVTGFFFSIFYCLVLDCGNMRPYFLRFFFEWIFVIREFTGNTDYFLWDKNGKSIFWGWFNLIWFSHFFFQMLEN